MALTKVSTNMLDADAIALGTQTTGHYVATLADAGSSRITVANSGSETAAVTLDIANDAIGTDQIANDAIGTDQIANDAIGADQLADNVVDIARLNVTDGTAGQSLTTDGSGALAFLTIGGAFNDFAIKTAGYTAVSKDQLIVTSASPVTITLPASPSAGNVVFIKNAGAGVVTVGRNGSNINSQAQDGTLAADAAATLVFVNAAIGFKEV